MSGALYRVDDDTLREVVIDADRVDARIQELESRPSESTAERVAPLRIAGRLDEALALARSELERLIGESGSGQLDASSALAAVRLASVLQWRNDHDEAEALYLAAIEVLQEAPLQRAFAEQHLGKSLFDRGRVSEARERFRVALDLRRGADAPDDLISSSLQSIEASRRRLASAPHPAQPPGKVRGFHHVELWVADAGSLNLGWAWLLPRLGFVLTSSWPGGESWSANGVYLTLTTSPTARPSAHDRRRAGMNHLAFWGGSTSEVDAVMSDAVAHGWSPLYQERYPHAGGPEHYAGWLENAEGFKVEVVAGSR